MRPKTEELLYHLLWTCQMLSRPTWRNMTESFEGWAYRNGLRRQLATLEKQQMLERQADSAGDRVCRLTAAGRLHALGGRDPEFCWRRPWDGRWRMVLFDLPQARCSARDKLRRYLRRRGFGYLQNSVWITPDPLTDERELLADGPVNVESLLILEAQPCAGETDAEIVAGAWNLVAINDRYARNQQVLAQCPRQRLDGEAAARLLQRWAAKERLAWLEAVSLDPLLPECLLPPGYLGRKVWQLRQKVLSEAGRTASVWGRAKLCRVRDKVSCSVPPPA